MHVMLMHIRVKVKSDRVNSQSIHPLTRELLSSYHTPKSTPKITSVGKKYPGKSRNVHIRTLCVCELKYKCLSEN